MILYLQNSSLGKSKKKYDHSLLSPFFSLPIFLSFSRYSQLRLTTFTLQMIKIIFFSLVLIFGSTFGFEYQRFLGNPDFNQALAYNITPTSPSGLENCFGNNTLTPNTVSMDSKSEARSLSFSVSLCVPAVRVLIFFSRLDSFSILSLVWLMSAWH